MQTNTELPEMTVSRLQWAKVWLFAGDVDRARICRVWHSHSFMSAFQGVMHSWGWKEKGARAGASSLCLASFREEHLLLTLLSLEERLFVMIGQVLFTCFTV